MLRIVTRTGSIYHIDLQSNTASRVHNTNESGDIRTPELIKFTAISPIRMGHRINMLRESKHVIFGMNAIAMTLTSTSEVTAISHVPSLVPHNEPLMLASISSKPNPAFN